MDPFSGSSAVCKKCGSCWIRTRYNEKSGYREPPADCLVRICEGCGYQWYEAPLDQGEQGKTICGAWFVPHGGTGQIVCNLPAGHNFGHSNIGSRA